MAKTTTTITTKISFIAYDENCNGETLVFATGDGWSECVKNAEVVLDEMEEITGLEWYAKSDFDSVETKEVECIDCFSGHASIVGAML